MYFLFFQHLRLVFTATTIDCHDGSVNEGSPLLLQHWRWMVFTVAWNNAYVGTCKWGVLFFFSRIGGWWSSLLHRMMVMLWLVNGGIQFLFASIGSWGSLLLHRMMLMLWSVSVLGGSIGDGWSSLLQSVTSKYNSMQHSPVSHNDAVQTSWPHGSLLIIAGPSKERRIHRAAWHHKKSVLY